MLGVRPTLATISSDDQTGTEAVLNNATGSPMTGSTAQFGSAFGGRSLTRDRNAPSRENLQAFKIYGKHVAALLGGFEQGAGYGFGVELSTANKLPLVELRTQMLFSLKFYRRFVGEAYFRSVGDRNTHASLWFNYVRRTEDNFFGLGPRTSESQETNFGTEERSYNASIYRDFSKALQAGIYGRISNTGAFRGDDDEDPSIDSAFSGNPAGVPVTNFLPGLNTNAKLASLGTFAEFDGRNNSRGLTRGLYLYGRVATYDGLDNGIAFSDYGWNELELDGRTYVPLGGDFTSLALRAALELKDPKGASQIPFYDQSFLGGRRYLRGFRNYRFRGNNSVLFSVEPRRTVWKRNETKGMDIFGFGDGGQVWGDNRSQSNLQILLNDQSASQNWRFGIGGGMQYRMNKSTAFRVDIGHSNESNMVYFSLSRGF
ncbi:MAG TPA: BamA/TamA family outer membrane protein [Blastocatellia bacterium]|nr:BamA/TamA family outer membrane protein [Blastocatellia bacterium]